MLAHLNILIKDYPVLATAGGIWFAAMISSLTRDLPRSLIDLAKRQLTTSIEVPSDEVEFGAITHWIESRGITKRFRSLRSRKSEVSVGRGTHFFRHKSRICWIQRIKVEAKDGAIIEELNVSCFGRDQKFLREFLNDAKNALNGSQATRVYRNSHDFWTLCAKQAKRSISSIYLPSEVKAKIVGHLENFFSHRDWYFTHGIPHRTGICLYGKPGTGKTSLVRGLCAQFDLTLHTIELAAVNDRQLIELMCELPPRALVLMEDIDTQKVSSRTIKRKTGEKNLTYGGLLNAIDGVLGSDSRVLVITTNHIEQIDPALLRPGRIDLSIELTCMNPSTFVDAFANFFPNYPVNGSLNWRVGMTPAEFQKIVLKNRQNPDQVLAMALEEA